jgi:transmembrane protein
MLAGLVQAVPLAPILWICRLGLCLAFLYSGVTKSLDFKSAIAEQKHFGMPAPKFFAVMTIAVQLGCSALMLFMPGLPAALGALTLAGFTLLASIVGHPFWRETDQMRIFDLNSFLEHFGIVAGFLLVALIELKRLS